jgi:hypothetical protein
LIRHIFTPEQIAALPAKLTTVPLSILTDEQLTGLPDKLTFVHWHLESMQAYGEEMHRGGFKCRGERLGRAGDGVRG